MECEVDNAGTRKIHNRLIWSAILLMVFLTAGCTARTAVQDVVDQALIERRDRIAAHFAPVIFQETDPQCYLCDYMTKFNFDGNYQAKDNWNNLGNLDTVPAYVYYSLSETESHYFIGYYFFHPRDWGIEQGPIDVPLSHHENDLEGVLVVVEKNPLVGYGLVIGMEAQAHDQQYQFSVCTDWNRDGVLEQNMNDTPGGEDVDGCVRLYSSATKVLCNSETGRGCLEEQAQQLDLPGSETGIHPAVAIQADGHGASACPLRGSRNPLGMDCENPQRGAGIIYYYAGHADSPDGGDGMFSRKYRYDLIAMDAGTLSPGDPNEDQGLWYLRNHIGDNATFASWGIIGGNDDDGPDMDCGAGIAGCSINSAKAPWVWDDPNDHQASIGDVFCDPAFLIDSHFDGPFSETYALHYLENSFATHRLSVYSVKIENMECDSRETNDCDVYLTVSANGSPGSGRLINHHDWQYDNIPEGEWQEWTLGGKNAQSPNEYSQRSSTRHLCRQGAGDTEFTFQIWDNDPSGADELGRSIAITAPSANLSSAGLDLGNVAIQYRLELLTTDQYRIDLPDWLERILLPFIGELQQQEQVR